MYENSRVAEIDSGGDLGSKSENDNACVSSIDSVRIRLCGNSLWSSSRRRVREAECDSE